MKIEYSLTFLFPALLNRVKVCCLGNRRFRAPNVDILVTYVQDTYINIPVVS